MRAEQPQPKQGLASRKFGGMRSKSRRSAEGPLPAEAGIDYVGLWEGGAKSAKTGTKPA